MPDRKALMSHFVMPLRVRYVECDMQGRAFNGHYLTWVDMAHTEALGDVIGGYRAVLDSGVDFVVAAAALQFRRPAVFEDRLLVHVTFHTPGNTSLRSDYIITRDDATIAECTMTHVCVDTAHYHKQPWPDWIRDRLQTRISVN